jgi:cyclophilin family peptidyl-prolyl cis-trans isomerase/outer membrane murein-binding lipoprotein Lpp
MVERRSRVWWLAGVVVAGCGPDPALQAELEAAKAEVEQLGAEARKLRTEADQQAVRIAGLERQLRQARVDAARARLGLDPGERLSAVLDTSAGAIRCVLFPDKAPVTVANFVGLAEGTKAWTDPRTGKAQETPLYDGTIFHRIKPGFMIQGGDPLGTGEGGPGYQFADETDNGLVFDKPGLLAMANRGPDTNGSQFFITEGGTPNHLDRKHTIFGECGDAEVVGAIARAPRDERTDRPERPVSIRSVRIVRGG